MLRQQAYLQVQFCALRIRSGHPVLADQDEGGEEYGLDRGRHRQDDKRRIKRADTGHYAQVDEDPDSEYRQMQIDEPHAPGEARYSVGEPLLKARLCLLTRTSLLQRLDVPFEDSAQAGRFGRRLCRSLRARATGPFVRPSNCAAWTSI